MTKQTDQHIDLTITIDGKKRLAFSTDYGWAEKQSLLVDMCNMEDARDAAKKFVKGLSLVPAENSVDNEDFLPEGEEAKAYLLTLIDNIKLIKGKTAISCVHPFDLHIKFEETYEVCFG